jgi:hypothetical protein
MSLADPDEEYEDLVPQKRSSGRLKGVAGKAKLFLILVVIGIIIGIAVGHYFVEPMLDNANAQTYSNCLETKEILSQENSCLYQLVPNAQEALTNCTT